MSEGNDDMRRPITTIAVAASSLWIGIGAGEAADTADPTGANPDNGIDVQVPDSNDRLDPYWTGDRMRAAKPMPKPVISRKPVTPVAPGDGVSESE